MANPRHGVTTPGVVLELEMDKVYRAVEVMNVDGADVVWVRADGQDPVSGEDGCDVMPATIYSTVVRPQGKPVVIRFLSDSSVRVSARGVSSA